MSDDLIERLNAATEGTTPGPWTSYQFGADWWVANATDDSGPMLRVGSWHDDREANARFIAQARQLVPEAAAALAAKDAEIARHKAALERSKRLRDLYREALDAERDHSNPARAALTGEKGNDTQAEI